MHSSESKKTVQLPLGPALREKLLRDRLQDIRYKIFVTSGKGGVGKSSVTANLATIFAGQGWHVGILDADLHGPSIPNLLGMEGRCEAEGPHSIIPVKCGPHLSVISMDALIENRTDPVMWKGPQKTAAIRQFISDVQWGCLDILLIDSPPGTGDEHMAVISTIPDAQCILVTTPQEISLADVRKAAGYLQRSGAHILGIVENMSGLVCPHCGENIDLFRSGGGRELALEWNLDFLGAIPLDPAVVVAADRGEPIAGQPHSPAGKAFEALSVLVREKLELSAGHQHRH